MSNRLLAVVTSLNALFTGVLGVSVIYTTMDPESGSPLTGIFDSCVSCDASSCYSFAGLHMSENRGMALAALFDVTRNRLRSVELVMSRNQISMAQAQTKSWLGLPPEDLGAALAVGLETRL